MWVQVTTGTVRYKGRDYGPGDKLNVSKAEAERLLRLNVAEPVKAEEKEAETEEEEETG